VVFLHDDFSITACIIHLHVAVLLTVVEKMLINISVPMCWEKTKNDEKAMWLRDRVAECDHHSSVSCRWRWHVWYCGWEVLRMFLLGLPKRSIPKPDQHRKDNKQQESLGTDML